MGRWGSIAMTKAIHLGEGKLPCKTRADRVSLWHLTSDFRFWSQILNAIYLVMIYTINTLGEGKPYRTNQSHFQMIYMFSHNRNRANGTGTNNGESSSHGRSALVVKWKFATNT